MKNLRILLIGVIVSVIALSVYFLAKPKSRMDYDLNIKNKAIALGMTREQVIASWGSPDSIQRTQDKNGMTETLVYYKNRGKPAHLKFQDGVLKKYNK